MKNEIAILAILLSCSVGYSQAVKGAVVVPVKPVEADYFHAKEWNLDLYGTGNLQNEDRDPNNVRLGLGVGGTYFLTRNFGLGLRAESESTAHSVFDLVQGRVTLRAPLAKGLSPYGFVQGGFLFERDRWQAGSGGGLELRFMRNAGVFGEAGLNVDTEGHGKMIGAIGLRLAF